MPCQLLFTCVLTPCQVVVYMCIVLNLDLMLLTAFGGKLVIDFVVDFWCSMLALGNLRIRHRILKKSPPPPGRPSSSPPGGPGGPALAVPGGSSCGSHGFGRDRSPPKKQSMITKWLKTATGEEIRWGWGRKPCACNHKIGYFCDGCHERAMDCWQL